MSAQLRWYAKARQSLYAAKINFLGDDVRIALLSSDYVPSDADEKWSDISVFEVNGSGYDAGGQALANKSITFDALTRKYKLDADDPEWGPNATIQGANVVCYDNTHSDKPLLGFSDYGDFACTNGTLKVRFSASGMFTDTLNP